MRWKFLINHKNMHWKIITNYFDFFQLCVSGVLSSQNLLQAQGTEWFSFKINLLGFSPLFLLFQSGRNRPFRSLRVYLCTFFQCKNCVPLYQIGGQKNMVIVLSWQINVALLQCGSTKNMLFCFLPVVCDKSQIYFHMYCVIQC